MAQYDGSIRINTSISTREAEKNLKKFESSISQTADEIAGLRSKMDALKDVKLPTEEYAALEKEYDKLDAGLSKLTDKQIRFLETGGKENSSAYKRMEYDLDALEQKQDQVIAKMRELEKAGKAFTLGSDTAEYAQMSVRMEQLNQQMRSDMRRQSELQSFIADEEQRLIDIKENATVADQELVDLLEHRKELLAQIKELEKAGVTEGYQENDAARRQLSEVESAIAVRRGMREAAQETELLSDKFKALGSAARKFSSIFRKVRSVVVPVLRKIGDVTATVAKGSFKLLGAAAKNAFSRISRGTKKSGGLMSNFASRLKGITLSLLVFNWITKAFNSMVNSIKIGFGNLYNENERFKGSVNSLKASMATLQNAFAAAFRPLVEIAIPYIQKAVEWITTLIGAVGQLIAALTGRKTYTKAIQQTAAAFGDTAKAANEAKEAVEGYLSPLDEINKFNKSQNSHADSGAGVGGSAGGPMFEEVPISDKFKDIVKWLKDMWADADFYELGQFLGERLKEALDNIPWGEIKETARKIGKSIASLINGSVEVEGLGYSIGRTLAEAFNTAFEFLNAFVHELHWASLGQFIAEELNGIFENIDWPLIQDTFITGAKGLGDAINSFVDYLNWPAIASTVSNFVNTFTNTVYTFFTTVDWSELGRKIGETISNVLKGIDWTRLGESVGSVVESIFELFEGFVASQPLEGLGKNLGDAINGAISKIDIVDFAESVSDFIIDLLEEFTSLVKTVEWDKFARKVIDAIAAVDWGGLASGLFDAGVEIINGLTDAFKELPVPVQAAAAAIQVFSAVSTIAQLAAANLGAIIAFLTSPIGIAIVAITAIITAGVLLYQNWDTIKDRASKVWEAIKNAFSNAKDNIGKIIDGIKENFEGWVNFIAGIFTGDWQRAWDGITGIFRGVRDTIKAIIDTILGFIGDLLGGIWDAIRGIGRLESKINGVSSRSVSSIVDIGLGSFSRSISPYANVPGVEALANAKFPGYATGQVIPRTMKRHLAWLGDNNQETEVVSPISTIEDALENTAVRLGLTGGGGNTYHFVAKLNGRTLFEETIRQAKLQQMATGRNPFDLGTT